MGASDKREMPREKKRLTTKNPKGSVDMLILSGRGSDRRALFRVETLVFGTISHRNRKGYGRERASSMHWICIVLYLLPGTMGTWSRGVLSCSLFSVCLGVVKENGRLFFLGVRICIAIAIRSSLEVVICNPHHSYLNMVCFGVMVKLGFVGE